jgi:hypothetical protein
MPLDLLSIWRAEEDANIRDLEVMGITITAPYTGTNAEGNGIGSTKQDI